MILRNKLGADRCRKRKIILQVKIDNLLETNLVRIIAEKIEIFLETNLVWIVAGKEK